MLTVGISVLLGSGNWGDGPVPSEICSLDDSPHAARPPATNSKTTIWGLSVNMVETPFAGSHAMACLAIEAWPGAGVQPVINCAIGPSFDLRSGGNPLTFAACFRCPRPRSINRVKQGSR